jgi:hypothetical protein
MLEVLDDFLPPPLPPSPPPVLPTPNVSLAAVTERMVGLGSRVGTDMRGPFSVAALKGIRIEAVVRYQLWARKPSDVDQIMTELIARVLGDADQLRARGFLRFELKTVNVAENVFSEDAWRKIAEFDVLFEFPYVDDDDADSLIARIPIEIDGEFTEATTVTDEITRWDNETAPELALRGVSAIGRLSALAFVPAIEPAGTVTITRTFDGAAGPPPVVPDLPTFLAAVTDPVNPARERQLVFASLTDFLAEFALSGDDVTLGDWDQDTLPDIYQSLALTIEPPIKLPNVADRLEIEFDLTPSTTDFAVVYLRAK